MKSTLVFAMAVLGAQAVPQGQSSTPPKPANMPKLGGAPVPMGPSPVGCSAYEILVARGTSEPGPFGVVVGDPLVANIKKALPDSRGYAVQYPADATPKSSDIGAEDVLKRLNAQSKACPNQKFALVGYSQGARVMRKAAPKIDQAIQSKIVANVMFGDPGQKVGDKFPSALESKLKENCYPGDPACGPGSDFTPHLMYSTAGATYQADSAAFIVAGFKGQPLPKKVSTPAPTAPKGTRG